MIIPLMTHTETSLASRPFRVATVAAVDSTSLGTTVIGGVLWRAVPVSPGTATCSAIAASCTGATSIRTTGFLSVACGIKINLFDYLSI